jgi:DNA-3-methyladenine glycosylase
VTFAPFPDRSFFARDARVVARALVGAYVVHEAPGQASRIGRIVETEAYRGPRDLACHARAGLTKRTKTLFGPPGHAYVFLIYGMHDCFNVVCCGEGEGHAVLVRAVEPVRGLDAGRTDGPGRLCRALGITRLHDGHDLRGLPLYVAPRRETPRIAVSARVGVAYAGGWAEEPWRFFDADSRHVSRPSPRSIGLGLPALAPAATASARRTAARAPRRAAR